MNAELSRRLAAAVNRPPGMSRELRAKLVAAADTADRFEDLPTDVQAAVLELEAPPARRRLT